MNAQVRINRFKGSILLAHGGKILINKNYGSGGREVRSVDGSETEFPVGSIGKQFVAAAILQLRDQGKLQLQDSVCMYVSHCPVAWEPVTILHLLTQTSGIRDKSEPPDHKQNWGSPSNSGDSLASQRVEPLEFAPGSEVRPSPAGYEVLGAVIERISGENCAKYVEHHIFQPLGMRNTGTYDTAMGMRQSDSVGRRTPILLTPSDLDRSMRYSTGAIYSTAEDLYRWDRALYTEALLSKQSLDEMSRPYRDGYGFGWIILKEFERTAMTQGSGIDFFSASVRRYPNDDASVIVLGASRNMDAPRISHDLAAIVFAKSYELPLERHAVKLDPSIYDRYTGQYVLEPDFVLTLAREGHRLTAQGTNQAKVEILPESEKRFFLPGVDTEISFVTSGGQVSELVLQQGGFDIPAPKTR
jgi:CubicO group peptidase (beta-lactamase class C family)